MLLLVAALGFATSSASTDSLTSTSDSAVPIFFASGCYWGRQHDMILFEQTALNRTVPELPAVSGYAGSKSAGTHGEVCYYNAAMQSVYSELGHAEAVQVLLEPWMVGDAARVFFDGGGFEELSPGVWAREDIADPGPGYRAILGLPGGMRSPLFAQVRAANVHNMTLLPGKGSDDDTFGTNSVLILDSSEFAFYPAETCMQFHDKVGAASYPPEYHALTQALLRSGRLPNSTACPRPEVCGTPANGQSMLGQDWVPW